MNLLAFDTSTSQLAIGVYAQGKRFTFDDAVGNTHSQLLLPAAQTLLDDAGITFAQLDAVAFGVGPGSFTGVRIACACAQGLGFAHSIPLIPIGTLESLAYTYGANLGQFSKFGIWCVNDARMNEVYCAAYRREGEVWTEMMAPRVMKPENATPPDASVALAGDAFSVYDALKPSLTHVQTTALSSSGLLAAARVAFDQHRFVSAADAQPIYVRDKVALTEQERAIARAAK